MEEMNRTESMKLLSEAHVGRLVVTDGKSPYVVPVYYALTEGSITIHTNKNGLKMKYLEKNPNVCFEVDEYSIDPRVARSVLAFGKARIVEDRKEKIAKLKALVDRYPAYHRSKEELREALSSERYYADCIEKAAIICIDVEKITGRRT
jgi:nitroimidazol reductase NimA-like FMN-containing flavoprotein (pyridoxamine 5'-phosphate oxidase superfamily)